ncbi:MAG: MMPL family transporter [Anaerohalosphaeraceae bacterium]
MSAPRKQTVSSIVSHFLLSNRLAILMVICILSVLSFAAARQLQVNTDFLSMLNPSEPSVQDYQYVLDNFSQMDSFVLYFAGAKEQAGQIEEVIRQIRTLPAITSIRQFGGHSGITGSLFMPSIPYTIVFVKPVFPPTNLAQSRLLGKQIQTIIQQQNLEPQITGSYQVLAESTQSITQDMSLTSIVTFAGLFILLFVVMRMGIGPVLAAMFSLTVGMGFTLAVTRYTLGQLNLLTATLPAVILGLGIDFSLHILYVFREQILKEPQKADDWQSHLESFFSYTFKPLAMGAVTTAAAFLSLCLASTAALRDMGLFGAIGIGCTFLTSVLVLPLLVSILPPRFLTRIHNTGKIWLSLYHILRPHRTAVMVCLMICLTGAAAMISRVQFSSDQNRLSDPDLPSLTLQTRLFSEYHIFPVPMIFISPTAEVEQKKAMWIQQHGGDLFAFIQGYSTAFITGQEPQEFIGKDNRYLTLAYPKDNIFTPSAIARIQDFCLQTKEAFPEQANRIAGSALIQDTLTRSIERDLVVCSLTACLIVTGMVYSGFRRTTKTILALLPMGLGVLMTIGQMGLLGLDFNMITIVIVPLIVGTGIDNGIHLLCKRDIHHNVISALSEIASPVTGTSLTSIMAFVSLLFCKNPGFIELGIVGISGFGFCMVFSLLFLPLLLNNQATNIKGINFPELNK